MLEINEIKNRLSDVLLELLAQFKSKSEMAKELESNSTSITQYMVSKNTYPQVDFIYRLCMKANINPTWLILGQGDKKLGNMDKTYNQSATGGNFSNITQIMHSNDMLEYENKSLKRENELLREMLEMYKNKI